MSRFQCRLTREEYGGWKALRMANGLIELFVVPQLGGRIIQLRLGSRDFLYVNPRHQGRVYSTQENCAQAGWKNYGGSKVWPAPQGWERADQWPGPPDPVLDGGPYACRVVEASRERVAIHLESAPDPYTGLILSRHIELEENSSLVRILHTMKNSSLRRVRWAIWQVTQQAADPSIVVYAPARRYRQMFGDQPFEHIEADSQQPLWKLVYQDQVAKFAIEPEEGWLLALHPRNRVALLEEFPLFPGEAYPDGAPAEVWVNGRGTYTIPGARIDTEKDSNGCDAFIETEVLSPLVTLDPGQEYSFPVTWRLTAVPSPTIFDVNPLALVRQSL
jgi:hypothetical protein